MKNSNKKIWIALVGMAIILLQLFGIKIDAPYVNEIVNSVCAICVVLGLINKDEAQGGQSDQEDGSEAEDSGEDSDSES